jgi:hypothetical protein
MQMTANASGMTKGLSDADKALRQLGDQTQSVSKLFGSFSESSESAAAAQQKLATDLGFLGSAFRTGQISSEAFAAELANIAATAKATAKAFEDGASVTARYRTEQEKLASELDRIARLEELGAISAETAARARADASGEAAKLAAAEKARADEAARLARDAEAITAKYQTDASKRAAIEADLQEKRAAGAISEETYQRAIADVTGATAAATQAEQQRLAVMAEGQRLAAQFQTLDERRAAELERIDGLLKAGAISEETAARARSQASGEAARAAEAEKDRLADLSRLQSEAAALTEKYRSDADRRADAIAKLNEALDAGRISEETHQRALEDVTGATAAAAKAEADRAATLAEGQRITSQFQTVEEKRAAELARIEGLLKAGAISEEIAARAKAEASGANAEAAKAEKLRADAAAAAARIIQANLTPQERYDQQVQELSDHLEQGRLSQEQFNRAAAKAKTDLDRAGDAADKAGNDIDKLSRNVSLLTKIEVGRLLIDGFQALSSVFTRVAGEVVSLAATVSANMDTFNDLSARTGIGVEALQGYTLAAKLAGVDTEQFAGAVQRLAVTIGKATPGDALDKSLRSINLSVAELRALSPEQQFSAIGDAISGLPTAADRAAAAVSVFGKQGAALAPLFREGAASIEELRARADRLGVIVSETQLNNIGDMNDGFDLVRATVEGIVGQVIGNLAPAVTAVTEQFLEFVETWEGSQGQGGTGIANAITDVLLQGADYFAGIFDSFMQNFGDISTTLADVGEVFRIGGQLLVTGMEGFRAVFNVIQIGIDALLIGFGKVLEGVGSWVSEDLEQFGAGLAAASEESAKKNAAEMEAAAANAANAFNSIFTGGGNAEAAGEGEAQKFVQGLRSGIENARLPEVKVQADLASATDDLDQFLKTAEGGTSEFLQQSQATLATFSQMAGEGELTADQIKIMNGFMEKLNQELTKEKQLRQEATEAAEAQAEADRKRLDTLLQSNDAASKIEQDLAALERERQRINEAGGEDAQQRLAQLDGLQAKLEEQQQALDQGFGQGFEQAFEGADKAVDTAIQKAQEFGQAGFDAALQLQQGVEAAQQQAEAGILNQEAFDAEVERQQQLFDQRIANEKKVIDDRNKAEAEATKLRKEQEKTVNDLITQQEFGGDNARIKAAENLVAIEAEIARAEEDARKARKDGDDEALAAANKRIAQLDQVEAKERDIASGASAQREEFQKRQAQLAEAQAKQQQQIFEQQKKFAEEQAKAEQAEFERQEKRLAALNTLGPRQVQTADVRTQEGQQLVLDLFNQQQDPQLIQLRSLNKVMTRIAASIDRDLTRLGQPATIFP